MRGVYQGIAPALVFRWNCRASSA